MNPLSLPPPPCVVFEDDDLLVVQKPPGWNTHAPSPYAGEGIHEWLKHREPRWSNLAIVHRLDKDTSGLLVFCKTAEANRSLTAQFAQREVHKRYLLLTEAKVQRDQFQVVNEIFRVGDHCQSRPLGPRGDRAETRFRVVERTARLTCLIAEPVTGRTHQIRVHAAGEGFPILGDPLYGGAPAHRLHLHSAQLEFRHPRTGAPLSFAVEPDWRATPAEQIRRATLDPAVTDAFRLEHGAASGRPGRYVDRLGGFVLIQDEREPRPEALAELGLETSQEGTEASKPATSTAVGIYFKRLDRQVRKTATVDVSPRWVQGTTAPDRFEVRENGLRFELSFQEGYSTGLFLDQRDNRRRLLTRHIAARFPLYAESVERPEVLNCFAYTCAFSVCAGAGGARTTSLDLSRKYLDWGRRNFALNGQDPAAHDFIYGDVFDWLQRLVKRGRRFDVVVLDPPTFSRSREHGDFRAESDYDGLVGLATQVLKPGGVLLASTNAARLAPERFLEQVHHGLAASGRRATQEHYVPQPPDFPMTREEPGYLKTVWLRVS